MHWRVGSCLESERIPDRPESPLSGTLSASPKEWGPFFVEALGVQKWMGFHEEGKADEVWRTNKWPARLTSENKVTKLAT